MKKKIKLGISPCLLGKPVRYDGGQKTDHFLTDILSKFVDYVPVCPEYEAGLGVPREAMRLTGDPTAPRLMTRITKIDRTPRLQHWISGCLAGLEKENICGFIFKSRSPSCGMERVKVYNDRGSARKTGVGLFARAFMDTFPFIPAVEDESLNNIDLRENFIIRIFACSRLKEQFAVDSRTSAVIEFHRRHKYLLMAHSPAIQKEMGNLVAQVKNVPRADFIKRYESLFMNALRYRATVKKNANVLTHIAGYFKKRITADERKELQEVIEDYQQERIPLMAPITLLRHYVRKYGENYLADQYYLYPHPLELKLRYHA